MLGAHEKPDVTYADVGGLDMQKQEIREAVELPLTHFELYKQIGGLSNPGPWSLVTAAHAKQALIHRVESCFMAHRGPARPCW